MSFFQNTCKPKGLGGSLMVNMMNIGHSPMAEWGLKHIKINKNDISLDVGCGGGANIKKLLEKSPKGKVFGIDYSEVSVRKSKKVNKFAVERKHCEILQGNVQELPFANETFDLATAFETIYLILSRLVDTFFSRISLTMPPAPKSHNTACVLPQEEPLHWQSRSSGYSSS